MGVKVYDGTSGQWVEFAGASGSDVSINNNADNRIITGSNTTGELNAEQYLLWNGATLTTAHSSGQIDINPSDGGIEMTRASGGGYIDFKDSTSDNYDVRIGQDGTSNKLKVFGDFEVTGSLIGATRILFEANKFDFAPLNTTQSAVNPFLYQGFTIVTTVTRSGGSVYDTGISVSQGNGGGMALLMSSGNNNANLSGVGCRLDLLRFAVYGSFNGDHVAPDLHNISATGGGGGVSVSVGKSAQNTLTISINKQGRWTLLMMGENIVTSI